jgi:DNA-binding NarL/FixJ family response regulator
MNMQDIKSKEDKIKILIVDDAALIRSSIGRYISIYDELSVEHYAEGWKEADKLLEQKVDIDLMLIDLGLTNHDPAYAFSSNEGLNLAKYLKERHFIPRVYEWKTIIITGQRNPNLGLFIHQAFSANINGFLLKTCPPDELILAFKSVMAGENYYRGEVNRLLSQYMNSRNTLPKNDVRELKPQELEVLELVSEGWKTTEIAKEIPLSNAGVEAIRSKIMEKLGGKNITHCVSIAYKLGILKIH